MHILKSILMENSYSTGATIALILLASIGGLLLGWSSFDSRPQEKKKEKKEKKVDQQSSSYKTKPFQPSSDNTELRGYKKTSDGKTTTYFNRDLSEEDKKLLGDSCPKKITSIGKNNVNASSDNLSINEKPGSVWNSAGTWEEKSCDKWAIKTIKNKLQAIHIKTPDVIVTISDVNSIQGEASITTVRGKKKYIYDFSLDIAWKASIGKEFYSGIITVTDISADCDYEVSAYSIQYIISITILVKLYKLFSIIINLFRPQILTRQIKYYKNISNRLPNPEVLLQKSLLLSTGMNTDPSKYLYVKYQTLYVT